MPTSLLVGMTLAMRRVSSAIAVFLSLPLSVWPKTAVAAETPRGITADFAIRDSKAAAQKAVDFFTAQSSGWIREIRPFRAESVIFARSPVQYGTELKKGDPIWIVVVVNDAQSDMIQVPVEIVWVRSKDGTVLVTQPAAANHPTSPPVTPPSSQP